jgi:DNA-binding transcriptional regulator YdaS (Cro superfamily)
MVINEPIIVQILNTSINLGILIAIARATRAISRLELKVELMWETFSRNMKVFEPKEK